MVDQTKSCKSVKKQNKQQAIFCFWQNSVDLDEYNLMLYFFMLLLIGMEMPCFGYFT